MTSRNSVAFLPTSRGRTVHHPPTPISRRTPGPSRRAARRQAFRAAALVLALITGAVTAFAAPASAAHGQGTLRTGETLLPGQYLIVPGHAQLIMQTDGNLVLYRLVSTPPYKVACAASHTTAHRGSRAWMSPDGRFSVFTPAPANRIVWSTGANTRGWTNPIVQLLHTGAASVNGSGLRFTFWSC